MGDAARDLSRRDLLLRAGMGAGIAGLAHLLGRAGLFGGEPGVPTPGLGQHHPAKARSLVWLHMHGAPSSIDLFDPKPELERSHGKSMNLGKDVGFFADSGRIMRSPFAFARHGKSGTWMAEIMPHLAKHVDDLAWIRSMHVESNNHGPALYQFNTGFARIGFPSAGAWLNYGLGSLAEDLPGFVVMLDARGAIEGGPSSWGAGFLPGRCQGTPLRPTGQPLLNLGAPAGLDRSAQRRMLDLAGALGRDFAQRRPGDEVLQAHVANFELAYRMQAAAPDAIDIAQETAETRELYGIVPGRPSAAYGTQLLLARRLIERGVRVVQIFHGPYDDSLRWDAHADLKGNHTARCAETDVCVGGFLTDLKRRGLLDQTLVMWAGEFGRLPISQGEKSTGRDHNRAGFTVWLAGGGVKGGASHGETDELGWKAARDPVSVHDLHATLLHLMGIDHRKLTFRHDGRDYRLTDTAGEVIRTIVT